MRRIALLLAALLALAVPAMAEPTYIGTMMVDNCEEWVSLREGPGTDRARLAKVPLYGIVTDAERDPSYGDFTYVNYDGQYGYILSRYLVPWADPEPENGMVLDATVRGHHITATRTFEGDGEILEVACDDVWTYTTRSTTSTELDFTDAFIGYDDRVMVYNTEKGLTALDPETGETLWTLEESLGASITHTMDAEGTLYIGGYYGPDPVAVDVNGHVKWRASAPDCNWLYKMFIENGELVCTYDMMPDGETGYVVFDLDGNLLRQEKAGD